MKSLLGAAVLWRLSLALQLGEDSSRGSALRGRFGPRDCVQVRRSAQGTCEIVAKCSAEDDLSGVEFAFVCQNGTRIQKHTFGVGSFSNTEAYDSGVSCERCREPGESTSAAPAALAGPAPKQKEEEEEGQGEGEAQEEAPPNAVTGLMGPSPSPALPQPTALPGHANVTANVMRAPRRPGQTGYSRPSEVSLSGPEGCVQTFRSPGGTCVMETRCKGVDTRRYSFGFTCVQEGGGSTRHTFEPDALGPEERFDTEVNCEACLGLDTRPPGQVASSATPGERILARHPLESKVRQLADKMRGIVQEFHWLSSNVTRIKKHVASESPPKPPQALVGKKVRRSRTAAARARKAGHRSRRAAGHRRYRHLHARQLRHHVHRHARPSHRPRPARAHFRRRAEDADGGEDS